MRPWPRPAPSGVIFGAVETRIFAEAAMRVLPSSSPVLFTLAAAALVTACSSPGPRYDLARAALDELPDTQLDVAPVHSASHTGPWRVEELLQLARRNNATLLAETWRTRGAVFARDEAAATILGPRLNARAFNFRRSNLPRTEFTVGPITTKAALGQKEFSQVEVTLQQRLLSLADQYYRIDAARLDAGAARMQLERVRQEVRRIVLGAIFDLLIQQDALRSVEAVVENLARREEETRRRYENGLAIENDVYKVQVERANQAQAAFELRSAIRATRVRLALLCGLDPESPLDIAWSRDVPDGAVAPRVGDAWRAAVKSRPDLHALSLSGEAFRRRGQAEWADYLPAVDLQSQYVWTDQSNLVEDDYFSLSLIAGIDLLDLSRHARIARFEAGEGEMAGRRLELERRIRGEIEVGCLSIANELSRLKFSSVAVKAGVEDVRVLKQRYDNGLSTANDLLEAEVRLLNARVSRIQARYRYFQNLAELDAIVGADGFAFRVEPPIGPPEPGAGK